MSSVVRSCEVRDWRSCCGAVHALKRYGPVYIKFAANRGHEAVDLYQLDTWNIRCMLRHASTQRVYGHKTDACRRCWVRPNTYRIIFVTIGWSRRMLVTANIADLKLYFSSHIGAVALGLSWFSSSLYIFCAAVTFSLLSWNFWASKTCQSPAQLS